MSDDKFETQHIPMIKPDFKEDLSGILNHVYCSLKEKEYDPVMQIMGYILSGDPSYITNHNNARKKITGIPQNDLLEYFIRYYFDNEKLV